ncbi:nuclease SbcCD subunit C [Marinobacterium zhoushanense]|uniref:Nuclease SbcCD subunit C n=1 Tax=Marinobacterium zhoushanense TaxID=1679163 RepID=A0ABQ1K2P8_9GAMM|nr:SMC family ATPase [Marinobacterium zhoushanense]GGB82016.1 nuclease SbcCD subunit C [Marinobacterium zhoushanense]
MKLHTLKLAAFGPFANEEQIDFAALGDNPLFLIDGPTGAGKSSILHAVCYALYGETTDAERKELGIRCDYAEPETLTEIALEFSIRGQRYRIHRIPTQMRPAKRGGGETEEKASAHLIRIAEDGTEETLVPKKKTEADAAIKEILGLTADQFRQVMVLPQGKFRELLLAKSDDRQEILSTLFQTEIYKRIEQLLKERAGDIERQNKTFEERKAEALLEIHLPDVDALLEAITQANTAFDEKIEQKAKADAVKRTEEQKLQAAQALQKQFDDQAVKQQTLTAHRERQSEIDTARVQLRRAEKAAAIAPEWKALQALDKQIQAKEIEKADAEKARSQAEQAAETATTHLKAVAVEYEKRDSLKADETRLTGYQKVLAGYVALKADVKKADAGHAHAASSLSALDQQISALDESVKAQRAEIDTLATQVGQKAECTGELIAAKQRLNTRTKLDAATIELTKREGVVKQALEAFEQADAAYRQASTESDRLEMFWYANQAALLAQKLEEDHPCPVCGSHDHPHPAVLPEQADLVDQEAVEQARGKASARLNQRYSAEQLLAESKSAVQNQQQLIQELSLELGDDAARTLAELSSEHREQELQLQQITVSEKRLDAARQNLKADENQRVTLDQERARLSKEIPQLSAAKAAAESRLTAAEANLPEAYRSLEALKLAINQTRQTIAKLEANYQAAQAAQVAAANEVVGTTSTLQALIKLLEELQASRTAQFTTWQHTLASSEFADQVDFESSVLEEVAAQALRATITEYDEKLKALISQLELIAQQLSGQQPPDIAVLAENHEVAVAAYLLAERLWSEAQQYKGLLDRTLTKIRSIEAQQQVVKQQYEVVGKMAKAASGKGDVRVSLERFVLGNLLDSVLSVASQRLYAMSKGQYRLVRQNEVDQKRNMTAGLDLAIDDAYSGKTRPVATLSGGESFMASLSLALALSDVVQQRSGGIQLDTLFIDEGFGSLDQESLQLAIDMLVELQATGRTIGIISHVSELKEQMPLRIDVRSGRTGSNVSMSTESVGSIGFRKEFEA